MRKEQEQQAFTRFYLHGDYVEGKPGVLYCARCDEFVGKGHFFVDSWHCGAKHDDYGWYLKSKRSHYRGVRNRQKEGLVVYNVRPKNAKNFFEFD